ncbi:MAG: hypothetical protein KDN22_16100 [Verrucomicrobiae bacterium]|nr:hypothetical protein [Verrucomicrobiae bacterium]
MKSFVEPCLRMLVLVLLAATASGQTGGVLKGSVTTVPPLVRSRAPIPLLVTLHWDGSGFLIGDIKVTITSFDEPVFEHITEGAALQQGLNEFRMMVPVRTTASKVFAQLEFIPEKGSAIDLGGSPLPVPTRDEQGFTILVGSPKFGTGQPVAATYRSLWHSLRFELLVHEDASVSRNGISRNVKTYPALMGARDFPKDPIEHCAYDVVFLQDDISWLDEKQLTSLTQWVHAGGCLVLSNPLSPSEKFRDFLLQMANVPASQLDLSSKRSLAMHSELGRVLVLPQGFAAEDSLHPTDQHLPISNSPALPANVLAFIWRFGHILNSSQASDQLDRIVLPNGVILPNGGVPPIGIIYQENEIEHGFASQLSGDLLPTGVEAIPLGSIALIVTLFILISGPIDYFVLGKMRRRVFTWIVHPCVALAVTLLIVTLTNRRLAVEAPGRKITIIDIGKDGRPLSENCFQLHFAYNEHIHQIQHKNTLVTRLPSGVNDSKWWATGRFPTYHVTSFELAKWSPLVTRSMTIGDAENSNIEVPQIEWDTIDPFSVSDDTFSSHLLEQAKIHASGEWLVKIWRRGKLKEMGEANLIPKKWDQYFVDLESDYVRRHRRFLNEASIFDHVHSPSGSASLEDIPRTSVDDDDFVVVVLVVRDGGDLTVYRRAYRNPSSTISEL